MQTTYTDEEIESRFQKLPQVLQDAMCDPDIAEKMGVIGKMFGLLREKIRYMSEETGYIILGLTRPQEFVNSLAESLEVNTDKAKVIAKEINHQIFFPLREALKTAHQVEVSEDEIERGAAMMKKAPTPPLPPKSTPPPPPRPTEEKKESPLPPPPTVFPQKIVLEKKPELNLPPSKIPPIDLRNPKEPVPPPTENTATAITTPPSPTTTPPQPSKKNVYEERDPYKEPVE